MLTHVERIRAAALALDSHTDAARGFGQSPEEQVIDLLTNLLHYARFKGMDAKNLAEIAVAHFNSESEDHETV